jgi:cytochrome P450 family 4
MANEHGPVWNFQVPFGEQIIVHDPKAVEEILSSQKILDKSMEYDFINDWLGTGLLISTGKKWHQRRKMITPTFHFKILEQFVDVMNRHGDVFVQKLKKLQGRDINIYPMISLYALDVICGESPVQL